MTPLNRIDARFTQLQSQGRKGLIPYFAAGHPTAALTVPVMHALTRAGADVIELGVPFSDPSADGPVIQRATEIAIKNGVGLARTLEFVREFRQADNDTPVVLMGYANPIELMAHKLGGMAAFAAFAKQSGVDGLLVVDYPPEECEDFAVALKAVGLAPIFLLAPTSTDARIASVAKVAAGYIYYVSLKGITGAGHLDVASVAAKIPLIKQHGAIPVGVGFGIRDAASAKAVAQVADAVVIGSRIIQELENAPQDQAVAAVEVFLSGIRQALDA